MGKDPSDNEVLNNNQSNHTGKPICNRCGKHTHDLRPGLTIITKSNQCETRPPISIANQTAGKYQFHQIKYIFYRARRVINLCRKFFSTSTASIRKCILLFRHITERCKFRKVMENKSLQNLIVYIRRPETKEISTQTDPVFGLDTTPDPPLETNIEPYEPITNPIIIKRLETATIKPSYNRVPYDYGKTRLNSMSLGHQQNPTVKRQTQQHMTPVFKPYSVPSRPKPTLQLDTFLVNTTNTLTKTTYFTIKSAAMLASFIVITLFGILKIPFVMLASVASLTIKAINVSRITGFYLLNSVKSILILALGVISLVLIVYIPIMITMAVIPIIVQSIQYIDWQYVPLIAGYYPTLNYIYYFIVKSQPKPKSPDGTVIYVYNKLINKDAHNTIQLFLMSLHYYYSYDYQLALISHSIYRFFCQVDYYEYQRAKLDPDNARIIINGRVTDPRKHNQRKYITTHTTNTGPTELGRVAAPVLATESDPSERTTDVVDPVSDPPPLDYYITPSGLKINVLPRNKYYPSIT